MAVQPTFWWAGILLEAVGTLIGNFGKIMFRYAATKASDVTCCQLFGLYAVGLICVLALFPALDAAAYSLAAQSIVSSCSGLGVRRSPTTDPDELLPCPHCRRRL